MATPVIAGFHPDPSICRVDDTYYLANSSFEYAPGVPVHRSTDLLTWTQIGNVLTRPSQLAPHAGTASTGIYAPTLRHHDGRFWMVTTNVSEMRRGHLIVSAEQPEGPWTDPVYVTGTVGIDPDLAWDETGVCHLTWASFHPDLRGIASVPIDPATGAMLAEPRLLWNGTGLAAPEGPHLYRVGEWWYLLLAEGGTERGHAVTIARARTLDGPFEAAPHNPILTHRSTDHPVQNTGHADLVELADGSWAMVYLGVRPRGWTPKFHVNGRETFLAGVDWADGWPVVNERRFPVTPQDHSFADRFESPELDPRWVAPGTFPAAFARWEGRGRLVLVRPPRPPRAPALLLTRARDSQWTAQARLDTSSGTGRFLVRIDSDHWYGLTAGADGVEATVAIGPAVSAAARMPRPAGRTVTLRITVRDSDRSTAHGEPREPDLVELAVVDDGGTCDVLGTFDGRYLSTEVAGGFTGRMLGVELVDGEVALEEVSYSAHPGRDTPS
ncbi:family 43 glycosylhydrolase [Streptomyces sp. NPDC052020]|uniref:glycoside hydrolase family 43 protein n=1 Tax=Streptomyces sp. NPDC052020 TaxID=3155677 RepID=UPI00342EDF03